MRKRLIISAIFRMVVSRTALPQSLESAMILGVDGCSAPSFDSMGYLELDVTGAVRWKGVR